MSADRDVAELLAELGFSDPAAQQIARTALEEAGLVNARKSRVSDEKVSRIAAHLEAGFARTCADPACAEALRRSKPGRSLVRVADPRACERCGGSDNRKAARRLSDACARRGITRVVVVGGSPSVRDELRALSPAGLELRLVNGTERRTQEKARADLDWAELVLVWGSSELDHKVSKLYTDVSGANRRKVVQLARRGIAALLNAGSDHLERS